MMVPYTNSWVVPHFKFRNRDLHCTIPRNELRLQYTSSGNWRIYFQSRCCLKTTLREPACLSLGSRRCGKQAYAIFKSIKWFSAAQVENLRHSKGSVSHAVWPKFMCEQPQIFHKMKYWASRQNWNLRTWKYQTQTLELCHLLASNSKIGICIAPFPEMSLDSNTQAVEIEGFIFNPDVVWKPP